MNVANFTEKSKQAITVASNLATQNKNAEITELHMLLSLISAEENYRAGMEAGGYFRSCRLFKKYLRGRFNFF